MKLTPRVYRHPDNGAMGIRIRELTFRLPAPVVADSSSRMQITRDRFVRVEQRISLITLGVADVSRARAFYERLGWQGQEVEETVFFQTGGTVLILWGRDKLAEDSGVDDESPGAFGGFAIAHNVRSQREVDEVLSEAATAGATITQPARQTFYGGYAGSFADPDGHIWEIAYNPGFGFNPDGSVVLPDFGGS